MKRTNLILFTILALCILSSAIYFGIALISPPPMLPARAFYDSVGFTDYDLVESWVKEA